MATSSATTPSVTINNNEEKRIGDEEMQVDSFQEASCSSTATVPRVPSPMITVSDVSEESAPMSLCVTPTRDRKKSPSGAAPRQRKRSQPVRGELLPDPDKLLSYKHHDKKQDEVLEDPSVPGGQSKPPPEPRQAGQAAERKRSTVTFCPVIETIEK